MFSTDIYGIYLSIFAGQWIVSVKSANSTFFSDMLRNCRKLLCLRAFSIVIYGSSIWIMYHILEMPRNLIINLYLRPFSIAIYGKLLKLFLLYFLEDINLALRQKNVQNLLMFVYLFFPKNRATDSKKSSITLKWLVVDSCPTPHWIAFLMHCRFVCSISPIISIN